jgi:hypothetical protein
MISRKRGRPPLIPNRTTVLVYLTRQEARRLARAAQARRLSRSAWLREVALAALEAQA